jgi:hypothetical protein
MKSYAEYMTFSIPARMAFRFFPRLVKVARLPSETEQLGSSSWMGSGLAPGFRVHVAMYRKTQETQAFGVPAQLRFLRRKRKAALANGGTVGR